MSSLAGALVPPDSYSYSHNIAASPSEEKFNVDDDVLMNPPDTDVVPKEEFHQRTSQAADNGDEEMEDLFGNDEEPDDAKSLFRFIASIGPLSPGESGSDSEELSQAERDRRKALEYAEPEEPATLVEHPQEANVSIPNIPVPRTSDGDHWVIRMPNFVKVDSKPFHPDTYIGPEHEDEEAHHAETIREKSMTIKLKVENTVRWKWDKDEFEQDKKQSNSRVIRWSDGTLSLRLGKELFDINQTVDTSAGVARTSLGGSQASQSSLAPSQQSASGSKSQGLTYLVAQHKRSELLQAEAVITGYMSLRPTGMQSETHRMLVRAVGQKHNKVARLRMAPDPTMDPEREKMELIKLSAKKSKKKADDAGFGGRRRRTGYTRKRAGHDVWSDDEDEHEAEYAEEDDDMAASRGAKRRVEDDKKKGPGDYQEDDFVVADDSDEDAEYAGAAKAKRRQRRDEEDPEEDPLDQLDAKISQQQESERKRKHRNSGEGAGQDEDNAGGEEMDVESEEEEEEEQYKVRRAGTGARKKRAIDFDDDEDED
ncbi:hypothetical protein SERLA73DRAFT_111176 [Serpula lacrymans var. lacrymans S7.3]|uniref:Leo1-like protein n=1 Tax=Serpula lacrymans var. lacrymans (strain S7.3) TaxID=936435 RepID=F8Q4U9_SERL3|nr:hypothetical protein SERLA73DRAFT_111176 [Serpula lacrymans var. lacrymans S7.3]